MNVHRLHDKLNVGVEYGAIINAVAEWFLEDASARRIWTLFGRGAKRCEYACLLDFDIFYFNCLKSINACGMGKEDIYFNIGTFGVGGKWRPSIKYASNARIMTGCTRLNNWYEKETSHLAGLLITLHAVILISIIWRYSRLLKTISIGHIQN